MKRGRGASTTTYLANAANTAPQTWEGIGLHGRLFVLLGPETILLYQAALVGIMIGSQDGHPLGLQEAQRRTWRAWSGMGGENRGDEVGRSRRVECGRRACKTWHGLVAAPAQADGESIGKGRESDGGMPSDVFDVVWRV